MKLLFYCQCGLIAAGTALLAYWGAVTVRARLFQRSELQATAMRPHRTRPAQAPYPQDGTVLATLSIPDLRLSFVVVEGVSSRDLSLGPGHIPGTPLPGEDGNVAIAGHRDTVFRPLRWIRPTQTIRLTTPRGERDYRVVSTEIVNIRDVRVLNPTERNTLTLVTCYPFYYVGHAPKRFIVHADAVPEPVSSGRPPHS